MKILHVSHHNGCIGDINYVASELNVQIETLFASWNYNVGYSRAELIWREKEEYFKSFDIVITSDTAPLSRIFLQNGYSGKLVIWVCNRIDYHDHATNDCGFPDPGYYGLLRKNIGNDKVVFAGYTAFENVYSKQKGVDFGDLVIRPVAGITKNFSDSGIPIGVNKSDCFFIPPYHNDTIFMNLQVKCESIGIKCFSGRYNGPLDLARFRGVIHIPYAWSNISIFEAIHLQLPYFVPSLRFIKELSLQPNFFWSPPFQIENITLAEWYQSDFKDILIYFDSWEDLVHKIDSTDINSVKDKMLAFSRKHKEIELNKWRDILIV